MLAHRQWRVGAAQRFHLPAGLQRDTQLGTSLLVMRWARATAERTKSRGAALAKTVKFELLFKARPGVGSYDPFAAMIGETVGRWSHARLTLAIAALLQADAALKGTTISDEGGTVTDLVLALATSRAKKAA